MIVIIDLTLKNDIRNTPDAYVVNFGPVYRVPVTVARYGPR